MGVRESHCKEGVIRTWDSQYAASHTKSPSPAFLSDLEQGGCWFLDCALLVEFSECVCAGLSCKHVSFISLVCNERRQKRNRKVQNHPLHVGCALYPGNEDFGLFFSNCNNNMILFFLVLFDVLLSIVTMSACTWCRGWLLTG